MGKKQEYTGKDINDAIIKACKGMNVPREELEIEVLSTGSTGIFGLCRQKVKILVSIKEEQDLEQETAEETVSRAEPRVADANQTPAASQPETRPAAPQELAPEQRTGNEKTSERAAPVSPEMIDQIQNDIRQLLELLGFSSEVTVSLGNNHKVRADISGEHIDSVIGPGGKTLDSLQYLLRKIFSKKFPHKILFSLDAGKYRAARMKELEDTAHKLAVEVKETGKTKTIPALNPAERRVVHMVLHNDTDIRSRSVGDGLFKKVLIYLPGKGKKKGPGKHKNTKSTAGQEA